MTNVDFFRAFAADTTVITDKVAYYFAHDLSSMEYSTLSKYSSSFTTYMLHYTKPDGIDIGNNDFGNLYKLGYSGGLLIGKLSDLRGSMDGQKQNDYTEGKYELDIKPFINQGAIIQEILNFSNQSTTYMHVYLKFGKASEIINYPAGQLSLNGIWVGYDMLIRHDTHYVTP